MMPVAAQAQQPSPANPRPLLLLERDKAFSTDLAHRLSVQGGFSVTRAATVAEAEVRLAAPQARHDALLLDVWLSDGDGRELCARLRARGLRQPILMLSEHDDEEAVLRGLALGANDWVRKPCRTAELMARLRAQLRSFDDSVHAVFAIGPYEFRFGPRALVRPNGCGRIWLTGIEAQLLKFLCQAEGRSAPRQAVSDELWGTDARVGAHALEAHVYRLRRKLEPDPAQPRILLYSDGCYRLAQPWNGA